MAYLIGIDLGTSGTKTVVYEESGRALAQKTVEYPLYQPQNGWAEQEPLDWWGAVKTGLASVLQGLDAGDVAGIGISGQMHGLVMLDAGGDVLRPASIWCDQRTGAECEEITRLVGEKRIKEITANPALTGFTASKILWVRKHQPEIYERCAHILLPKDYIRYMLTGEFATEVSDASGMQLLDVPARQWSDEVLSKLGIDKGLLGSMHESIEVTGEVTAWAAGETGLKAGTPVVGGAGDNAGAAIGMGVVEDGKAFTTLGTSGVVFAHAGEVSIDLKGRVHTFCSAVPGKWTVMSCTQAAGLSLRWLRDTCCAGEVAEAEARGVDPYVILSEMAGRVGIGAGGLLYLPYLMGERSPLLDPDCRGVFFGLSAMHGREHLARAVMEGVAFSQLDCVNVFREMGVDIQDMMVCGGGARSQLWRQMLSDLYQCQISTVRSDEGASLGVAILAGVGTGVYSTVEDACRAVIERGEVCRPDADAFFAYLPYYQLYGELYLHLKNDFKALAEIVRSQSR